MALNSLETLSSMTWIPMKTDNFNPFTANQLKSNNMKKQARRTARTHHSAILEEFLALGTPEDLARTENRMLLSVKIQDAMTAKGIGKKQLAEMMGQSPSVITKWLSGGHNFTVDTLTDIQRILGVRLLALEENPVVENVYHLSIQVTAPNPEIIPHTAGQSFRLSFVQEDKVNSPVSKLYRQIPCA